MMFIKKSLFRSVLIIALLITSLISPSNGYANSKDSPSFLSKLFCSKEIAELNTALRDIEDGRKLYHEALDRILWWERTFSKTDIIEFQFLIKEYLRNDKDLFLKEQIKNIEKWHNLIKERHEIAYSLLSDMEREMYNMDLVHNETQLKQHNKALQILKEITEIQIHIAAKKEKLKELDREINALFFK
ncbi:hypothetical protein [Bartonella sp. AD13SXNS]|uniref:hypothetical protein n=1 Tax=Bartonella sp. AD13SXNS TaxID=3243462 RepID=UPI0035CE88C3